MNRRNYDVASMSVEALLELRATIGATLSQRAEELKRQLSLLEAGSPSDTASNVQNGLTKPRKVAPKYRGPNGELWAGRGRVPLWLRAALEQGRKLEDFSIVGRTQAGFSGVRRSAVGASSRRQAA